LNLFDACWKQASRSVVFGDEFESERFRIQHAVENVREEFLAKETASQQEWLANRRHAHPNRVKLDKRGRECYELSRTSQPTLFCMKTYHGTRTEQGVTVVVEENGERRELDPRLDLRNHSPTLFEWGYGGSGPAQLALALAADVLRDDEKAQDLYQRLKFRMIGRLPNEWWILPEDHVRQALTAIEQESSLGR